MARATLVLLFALSFLSPVSASLAPRPERPIPGRELSALVRKTLLSEITPAASARTRKEEFQVTDETEVTLDGRPCKYRDVPANATIIKLELAADRRTVVKVHFRSP
jgi:hypothetical protein